MVFWRVWTVLFKLLSTWSVRKSSSFRTFIRPFVSVPRARFVSFNDIANWVDKNSTYGRLDYIAVNGAVFTCYTYTLQPITLATRCMLFKRRFRHTMQKKIAKWKKKKPATHSSDDNCNGHRMDCDLMLKAEKKKWFCFHYNRPIALLFYPCLLIELEWADRFVSTQFTIGWWWRLLLSNRLDNYAISFRVLRCCGRSHNYPIKSNQCFSCRGRPTIATGLFCLSLRPKRRIKRSQWTLKEISDKLGGRRCFRCRRRNWNSSNDWALECKSFAKIFVFDSVLLFPLWPLYRSQKHRTNKPFADWQKCFEMNAPHLNDFRFFVQMKIVALRHILCDHHSFTCFICAFR